MHLTYRNVNDAFLGIVSSIHNGDILTNVLPSRVGEVLVVEEPVTVTYREPRERVLFSEARDANPFFHLFESLWMLAGRNDVECLAPYNSQISKIASDDGQTFNGAYGHRWIHGVGGINQLSFIVRHLKDNPYSRRAVLAMWCPMLDLLKIDRSKDVCCNTHVYFSIEDEKYLNMTVCNRSNDLLWGMLGANVVHFSMLQEYMSACIGVEVGTYHQFTNNLHAYTERFLAEHWLQDPIQDPYSLDEVSDVKDLIPLVEDPDRFDKEVVEFVCHNGLVVVPDQLTSIFTWEEPFLQEVAAPMCKAYFWHLKRDYDRALTVAGEIANWDWRVAGMTWLLRRQMMWDAKRNQGG